MKINVKEREKHINCNEDEKSNKQMNQIIVNKITKLIVKWYVWCGVVLCCVVLYCVVWCIICDAITHRCRLETSSSKHNTPNECILHYVCADCAFSSVECRYTTNMSIFKDFSHLMELKRAERRDCLPAYLYTCCRNICISIYTD